MKKIFYFILILFFLGKINLVSAAKSSLFFSPAVGTYQINSEFTIAIKIDSDGEYINAAEGRVNFDKDKLSVVNISKGNSIFSLWPIDPYFSNETGIIGFGGGVVNPGFKGTSGHVLNITFKTKKAGVGQLIFTSGAVLANDGQGTNVLASIGSGSYTISPEVILPQSNNTETTKEKEEKFDQEKQISLKKSSEEIVLSDFFDDNVWHNVNNLIFKWELPQIVEDVSFSFNKNKNADPGNKGNGLIYAQEFRDIEDGVWYFHLKFKIEKKWTEPKHYKIKIDTIPPQLIKTKVNDSIVGEWPIIDFETNDNISGVARYEVHIGSLEEKSLVLNGNQKSIVVSNIEVGPHRAMIKAIDNAGNESLAIIDFVVHPIESPKIINYSEEIRPGDKFFISGEALPDVKVDIFIKNEDSKIISKRVESDKNGNWFFVGNLDLKNGDYIIWTEAENSQGIKSKPSAKSRLIVTPPIFTRIGGVIINYFTVVASLIFIIVATLVLFFYLIQLIRSRLKKETIDVEKILQVNLENIRKEVEDDLAALSRYKGTKEFTKERIKTKRKITRKIDAAEQKIMKEVKDVEKILR